MTEEEFLFFTSGEEDCRLNLYSPGRDDELILPIRDHAVSVLEVKCLPAMRFR